MVNDCSREIISSTSRASFFFFSWVVLREGEGRLSCQGEKDGEDGGDEGGRD